MIPGLEIPPQYGWPVFTGVVLAIAGYVTQRALKNRPGAPTVAEAWEETRKVHEEMRDLRAGFDVLFNWMDRAIHDWGKRKSPPGFSAEERLIIDKIRPIPQSQEEGDTPR